LALSGPQIKLSLSLGDNQKGGPLQSFGPIFSREFSGNRGVEGFSQFTSLMWGGKNPFGGHHFLGEFPQYYSWLLDPGFGKL